MTQPEAGRAELRTTSVDLRGLMSVLSEHLYSTPLVAVRELVQNAHDSCTRRRIEDPEAPPAQIELRVDRARRSIVVRDNGAGLTQDEVVRYLATVGAGYTRKLRAETSDPELIGLFGLGFLSAFVIAESVSVWTTSYQSPGEGNRYKSRSAETYSLEGAPARAVGTEVELLLRPKYEDLLDESALRAVLGRYCALLPHPIFVGSDPVAINAEPPPWRAPAETPASLRDRERLAFASRFEQTSEPLCAFDVPASSETDLRGVVWVQSGRLYSTSDNRSVAVFVRGMLLDDDARELLPAWAGFMGAVVESAQLTPTASRETLKRDEAHRVASRVLTEAAIRGLAEVAARQPDTWRRILLRHNDMLLGAAVADDRLFNLLADWVTVPTSEGDLTLAQLGRAGDAMHVALSEHGGFEELLFRALKVPIVTGFRFAVLPFLEKCAQLRGSRVVQLGTADGDREVFRREKLSTEESQWLREALAGPGHAVVPARFEPSDVPLVLVPDQDVLLKKRVESDRSDRRIGGAALKLARLHTASIDDAVTAQLYVNLASPAVRLLMQRLREGDHERARVGADLLRALAALTAGSGEGSSVVDVRGALVTYTAAVCRALGGAA